MRKTLLLTALTLLFYSCSNKDLDRDIAFDIIEKFYEYPNVEVINFQGVTSSQRLNKEYNNLRGQKFITEKRKGKYGNEFWVIMTEKGKAFTLSGKASYNGYKVASSILELNEVTGIRFDDGKNTAYIDYNLKRIKTTPFGKSKEYKNGDLIEKKTVMQLYDDGWRITSNKEKNIVKVDNVKGFDEKYLSNLSNIMSEITVETGDSYFLLKETYSKYGKNFIKVDYVGEDGSNTNPKLRTFMIDETFYKDDYCGPFGKTTGFENFEDVQKLDKSRIAYIQVINGIVKCVEVNTAG